MKKKVLITNLTKGMIPVPLKRDGKLVSEHVDVKRSVMVLESELLQEVTELARRGLIKLQLLQ